MLLSDLTCRFTLVLPDVLKPAEFNRLAGRPLQALPNQAQQRSIESPQAFGTNLLLFAIAQSERRNQSQGSYEPTVTMGGTL